MSNVGRIGVLLVVIGVATFGVMLARPVEVHGLRCGNAVTAGAFDRNDSADARDTRLGAESCRQAAQDAVWLAAAVSAAIVIVGAAVALLFD